MKVITRAQIRKDAGGSRWLVYYWDQGQWHFYLGADTRWGARRIARKILKKGLTEEIREEVTL